MYTPKCVILHVSDDISKNISPEMIAFEQSLFSQIPPLSILTPITFGGSSKRLEQSAAPNPLKHVHVPTNFEVIKRNESILSSIKKNV